MVSPDIIKLTSEEFMALVEKYEAEAVKEYKEESPEERDSYIKFWIPINEKLCSTEVLEELKAKYLELGWRTVTVQFIKDRTTSLMVCLWA